MNAEWLTATDVKGFWLGVVASILATAIVASLLYIFRSSFEIWRKQSDENRLKSSSFENALSAASPYAPFAFGIAQGRALRLFFIAAVFALIGAVLSDFIYPLEGVLYAVALLYVVAALRWMNKIEQKALEIIQGRSSNFKEKK